METSQINHQSDKRQIDVLNLTVEIVERKHSGFLYAESLTCYEVTTKNTVTQLFQNSSTEK